MVATMRGSLFAPQIHDTEPQLRSLGYGTLDMTRLPSGISEGSVLFNFGAPQQETSITMNRAVVLEDSTVHKQRPGLREGGRYIWRLEHVAATAQDAQDPGTPVFMCQSNCVGFFPVNATKPSVTNGQVPPPPWRPWLQATLCVGVEGVGLLIAGAGGGGGGRSTKASRVPYCAGGVPCNVCCGPCVCWSRLFVSTGSPVQATQGTSPSPEGPDASCDRDTSGGAVRRVGPKNSSIAPFTHAREAGCLWYVDTEDPPPPPRIGEGPNESAKFGEVAKNQNFGCSAD